MYFLIKWVHVCSVMMWITGLLLQCMLLLAAQQKVQDNPWVVIVRRWEKLLSIPGVLLVWVTGFYLAMAGAWYQAHWFMAKASLVFLLSGIHGIFAANIRRYYQEKTVPVLPLLPFVAGVFFMVIAAIFLVVLKPF